MPAAAQTDEELRNARYDYMRQRAGQDLNASRQKASEAVDRRFAALGGLNSGASIKAQTTVQKNADRAGTDARMGIDAAQNQEVQQERQVEKQREFAKSEREAGQSFQAGENATNRGFATSERESSQGFASAEAGKGRDFSKAERISGQNFSASQANIDRAFREKQYAYDTQMKDKMFDFQKSSFAQQQDLAGKNYDLEKKVQEFNMEMARAEANKKTVLGRTGDLFTHWWKSAGGGLSDMGSDSVFGGQGGLSIDAVGGGGGGGPKSWF